jgi:hypothetical protein
LDPVSLASRGRECLHYNPQQAGTLFRNCHPSSTMSFFSTNFYTYFTHLHQRKIVLADRGIDNLGDNVIRSAEDVVYTDPNTELIDCIETKHDTFQCTRDGGSNQHCDYICRTVTGMQKHCKSAYNWEIPNIRSGGVHVKAIQT